MATNHPEPNPVLTDELRAELRDIRSTTGRRFRDAAGIDSDAIERIGRESESQYGELLERIRARLPDAGSQVRRAHDDELVYLRLHHRQQFNHYVANPPQPPCWCLPIFYETGADVTESSFCDGCFELSANLDAGESQANPRLEVRSAGPSATNSAELTVRFEHTFVPGGSGGTFCFQPTAQANGHYMALTWGDCPPGPGPEVSGARIEIVRTIQAYQELDIEGPALAAFPLYSSTQTIVDVAAAAGSHDLGGFESGTPAATEVVLNGNPVTVRVSYHFFAEVTGFGWAIIDMNSSPSYYCRVPELNWGPMICPR